MSKHRFKSFTQPFVHPTKEVPITYISPRTKQNKRRKTPIYDYICLNCQTLGAFESSLPLRNVGQLYFQSIEIDSGNNNKTYLSCPCCQNFFCSYYPTSSGVTYSTYITENKDKFTFTSYSCNYHIKANLDEDTRKQIPTTQEALSFEGFYKYLNGDEITLLNYDYEEIPYKPKSISIYFSSNIRNGIKIDKKSCKVLYFENKNQKSKFFTINRISSVESAKPYFKMLLSELPYDLKYKLQKIFIDKIHKNDLKRWEIGNLSDNLTSVIAGSPENIRYIERMYKLLQLAFYPNITMFSKNFEISYFQLDRYTYEKFKKSNKELASIQAFIPSITKSSIPFLKSIFCVHSQFSFDTFHLSLITDANIIRNLLCFYSEENSSLFPSTNINFYLDYDVVVNISFRKAKKILYQYLQGDALNIAYSNILKNPHLTNVKKISRLQQLNALLYDTIIAIKYYQYTINDYLKNRSHLDMEYENKIKLIQAIDLKKGTYTNVKALHDEITISRGIIDNTFYIYKYNEERQDLSYKFNDFDFILPKNTLELKELGQNLNLCVLHYEHALMKEECTIIAVERNKKPVLCLEIDKNKRIVQAKKHNNELLEKGVSHKEDDLINVLQLYSKTKKLAYATNDLAFV